MRTPLVVVVVLALAGCAPHDRLVGSPCSSNDECIPGTLCVVVDVVEGVSFTECAAVCDASTDWACEDRLNCYPSGYPGVGPPSSPFHDFAFACFRGGDLPLDASCAYPSSCERGLVCEQPREGEPGTCQPYCDFLDCAEGERCSLGECAPGLTCLLDTETATRGWVGRCARACEPPGRPGPSLCDDGSLCAEPYAGSAELACFPGGTVVHGEPCEFSFECAQGLGCSAEGVCVTVCNDDTDCASPETCVEGRCTAP